MTVARGLPMLKVWPGVRMLEACERAFDHVVDVAPGANLRPVAVDHEVAPASAFSMKARIAPPPIWPGPNTLNGWTVTAGRPSSSW